MNKKPEITISSLDLERLYKIIDLIPKSSVAGVSGLEEELARANIVDPEQIHPDLVTMNSTVKFAVESSMKEFTLTLVYPKDIDSKGERISILAPVGSALLGLTIGDKIEWPKPGGGFIKVTIQEILYQPERGGELHR
ncbi:nucleoside diphosphate kinase regulator [Vibrio sp. 1-Bac 57]